MSNPRKIEQLDEATELHDGDLVFASVLNAGNKWDSKKVTLENIANYVSNFVQMNISNSGFGGYEMIDTTEDGGGIYTAETISEYISDRRKNYLWGLYIGNTSGTATVSSLTKKVSKNCFVLVYSSAGFKIKINGIELNINGFKHFSNPYYSFYVKADQELKLEQSDNNLNFWVYIIPLKSGGRFYLDTSDPSKFYTGVIHPAGQTQVVATGDTNIFPGTAYMTNQTNNKPTIKVNRPTLFAYNHGGWGNLGFNQGQGQNYHNILNEKDVVLNEMNPHTNGVSWVFLDTGDTFTPYTTNPELSQLDWIAYPLLVDESGSSSGSGSGENKSCGYVQYDTEETDDPDVSQYESNYGLNYIQGLTIGSGNQNLNSLAKTFSKDCEVLLRYSQGVQMAKNSKSNVKIGNIDIPTMLVSGEYGLYDMKLYVKKDQTLYVNPPSSGMVTVYVNPLKSGGEFFIDGNAELDSTNNFESHNFYTDGIFEFTAPRKTLFIYRGGTTTLSTWQDKVTINGMKVPVRRHLYSYVDSSSGTPVTNYSSYLWNKFILDKDDKLKFNIMSSSGLQMHYNVLPLLES